MSRIETIQREIFKFSELSESAQDTAIQKHAESLDYEWWDSVYDDAATIAELMGIDLNQKRVTLMNGGFRYDPAINFSGFWSQGDGASYSASFQYKKGMIKAVKDYAPQDKTLHGIAERIAAIQKRYFYRLSGKVSNNRGNYSHSGSMVIDLQSDLTGYDIGGNDESDYLDELRGFADWIYSNLQREYEHLTSRESFIEACEANEWEFDSRGNLV